MTTEPIDPVLLKQFEDAGPALMRAQLDQYQGHMRGVLLMWLAQKDREAGEREGASAAEQMELARSLSAAASATNALAKEANSIARAASDSAKRSAEAALANNKIAKAALIVAAIAMMVSIIGSVHSCGHDQAAPKAQAAQTH